MQRVSRDRGLANILILDFWPLERINVHCFKPLSLWYFVTVSQFSQFSHSVMSNSLRPHELQHPRPPCPSRTPRAYPNSCPLSQRCRPNISSSVIPFSFGPQSFPASGSSQISQLFTSGGQNIGVSASTSVLPVNTQD